MEHKKKKNIIIGIVGVLIIAVIFGLFYLKDTYWNDRALVREELYNAINSELCMGDADEMEGFDCKGYAECASRKVAEALTDKQVEELSTIIKQGGNKYDRIGDYLESLGSDEDRLEMAIYPCLSYVRGLG